MPNQILNYRAIIILKVYYWLKNKQTDKFDATENLKTNPCVYKNLVYDKDDILNWQKKYGFFKHWLIICKIKMKADPYLTLYTKVKNSWLIEDLNVKKK